MISVTEICDFRGFSLKKACTLFFILFLITGNAFGQDPANVVPSYSWLNKIDVIDQNITSLDTDEIPISIDTDPNNFLYILTFGNGIQKRNADGAIINSNFITGLRSPLDFVIDDNGFFYVADYSEDGSCSQNGKIRIFNPDGSSNKIIYTGIYRPLGIDVDDDGNIYVAEYNAPGNGCESDELSRVSIYNQNGDRIAQNGNVDRPYRLAVSSNKTVFLSQEGNDNPSVLTLNSNLNITGRLPDIQSPGSINIDSFGFIHVIEYAGRIDFSRFINFENLSFGEIQDIAEEIDNGIDDNSYFVRIYNADEIYEKPITEKIEFPVDIAFNNCDRMYIDNAFANGRNLPFVGYVPEEFEFDIEIYERTPAFDITAPEITCPSDITVQAQSGNDFAVVNYPNATATDLCGATVSKTSGLDSGSQFPVGTSDVIFTATDISGNTSECTLKIIVEPADDVAPVASCQNLEIPLNSDGLAQITASQVYAGSEDLDLSISQTTFTCNDLGNNTITLTVTDPETGLSDTCEAIITVVDQTAPVFANNCSDVSREVTITEGETYTIPDFSTEFTATDNCDGDLDFTQDPVAGMEISETTDIAVRVSDDSGRRKTCLFTITVKIEEKEDTPPEFENCPDDFSVNNDAGECGAVVEFDTPTVNNDNGSITPNRTDESGLNSGDLFPVGETTITFLADDGVNEPVACSFKVNVVDNEDPVILTCPADVPKTVPFGSSGIAVSYEMPTFSDNCEIQDVNLVEGLASGEEFPVGTTTVSYQAVDASNNNVTCTFTVTVTVEDQPNQEPVTNPDSYSTPFETTLNIVAPGVLSNDNDPDGDNLIALISSDVSNGTLILEEDGSFTYTPDNGFLGSDTFTYFASDGEAQTEETVSIVVFSNESMVPVANDDNYTLDTRNGDDELQIEAPGILSNDSDPNGLDLIPSVTRNPSNGVLNLNNDGSFTFIPNQGFSGNDSFTYIVNNGSENSEEATVTITVLRQQTFDCPNPDDLEPIALNDNCDYVVPDYSGSIRNIQNFQNFRIEDSFTRNEDSVTVTLEVYDGEDFIGECRFTVPVIDITAPQISNCSELTRTVRINEGDTYQLDDYRYIVEVTDCSEYEVTQEPDPGTAISETTDVAVRVTDDAGNSQRCTFTVNITVVEENILSLSCPERYDLVADESCNFVVPDFQEILNFTPSEAVIEQNIAAGTLITEDTEIGITASLNGETEECSILLDVRDNIPPSISCPEDLEITLAEGENFTLPDYSEALNASDNCGEVEIIQIPPKDSIIDEDIQITFVVSDSFGNTSSCNFDIDIIRENQLNISCPDDKILAWDENCSLTLPDFRSEAEISNGDDLEIRQQPAPGTLITDENVTVTLSIENGENSDSCSFNIQIQDQDPPVLNLKDAELNLDSNSEAILNFSDIDNGSFDSCDPEVQYELSRSRFTCKDIGENTVQVTATDDNGNNTTGTVIITITDGLGICEEPLEEYEYIFIYPNPNTGSFKVATPRDETIERIEVFDHRGRFITAKDYEDSVTEYAMELGPLQEAVYVLKIVTNERTVTKRIVFKY